jgi:MFS family permease
MQSSREEASESARSSPLGLLFLTIFLDLVGFSIVFPLFPAMLRHYLEAEGEGGLFGSVVSALSSAVPGGGPSTAALFGGLLGSLYSILQFLAAPFWGGLSDRYGRRPVLLLTLGGMALSYAVWFSSGNFLVFIIARALGGIMGGNISVATAAVADATSAEDRARGMGVLGAAFGLGFLFGPAIGGFLSTVDLSGGTRSTTFFGLTPFSAVAAGAFVLGTVNWIVVALRFRETLRPEDRGRAMEEPRTANIFRLFRPTATPEINRVNWVWFLYLLVFSGMEFTLTFLATDRFGYTPRENAYLFVFVGLIMVFIQGGLIRRLVPLVGEKRLTFAGLLLVVPGLVLTGLASREGVLYLGVAFLAMGSACINPALTAMVSLYAESHRQGGMLGLFRSLGALARALGPAAAALAYWRWGPSSPYLVGAVLLLLPILLTLRLPSPRQTISSRPDSAA